MNTMDLAEILIVDDDRGDVAYTREVFADHRLRNRVTVLTDGWQAIAYLRRQTPYDQSPRPDLVFLELHLPGMDGRGVLDVIRADRELHDLYVVVLTTSDVDEHILRRLRVPAHAFARKPVDFSELAQTVRTSETLGLQVCRSA